MTVAWDRTLLVGDVGGTNARFAMAHMVEGRPVLEHHDSFPAETLSDLPRRREAPSSTAARSSRPAASSPWPVAVTDGEIDLTNSPWRVSESRAPAPWVWSPCA
jgi:glucokinase